MRKKDDKKNRSGQSNGFTLLEIVVVLSISTALILLVAEFIISGYRANLFGKEQDLAIQNARKVNRILVNELREAIQSERGDYILDLTDNNQLSFYSDIDKDSNVEKVRYFLDGTTLKRGLINPTGDPLEYLPENETVGEIAEFLNNQSEPVFTYYDTNNNIIVNPSASKTSIRLIHISLKINVTPTIAPMDYYVEMDAQLRNLKDNL